MSADVDVLLLLLRIISGVLLLAFVGAVFVMMWRDFRMVSLEVETRTRSRGRLVVINSATTVDERLQPGASFPLLPLTSVGRAPTNTIRLEDAFTSGEHATITLRNGRWWLEDRGSSNGTQLNGYRIAETVILSTGDIVTIGQTDLKIELE